MDLLERFQRIMTFVVFFIIMFAFIIILGPKMDIVEPYENSDELSYVYARGLSQHNLS